MFVGFETYYYRLDTICHGQTQTDRKTDSLGLHLMDSPDESSENRKVKQKMYIKSNICVKTRTIIIHMSNKYKV